MKRPIMAAIAGLMLLFGLLFAFGNQLLSPPQRTYSVAEVQAGLRRDPRAWMGRTVLVQGATQDINQYFPHGNGSPQHLRVLLTPRPLPPNPNAYAVRGGAGTALWAEPRIPRHPFNVLARLLRGLPLVGGVLPVREQVLRLGQSAVYRLTILPIGKGCPPGTCMEHADAMLDDVNP